MTFKQIKTAATIAMTLSCVYTAQAQHTISGVVTSPENKPIPFSVIGIQNTYLTAQTNAEGRFSFRNLDTGKYVLVTKCVGYRPKTDTVIVNGDASLEVVLNQKDVSLDEVLVYSTRANQNSAFAHSDLGAGDIKKQNVGQDLPYVLNSLPSVVINSDAGNGVGYTGMRVRGTDGTRINLTINGVPVNDAESQGVFFVNMGDIISSANSIQVQRGVGTSVNGAAAFGASINMQTSQLRDKPYAELNNSIGSYNTVKNTIAAGTGLLNNHFTFDARASRINSDGYIDRAFSRLSSFYLSGGYYGKKTVVKAILFSGQEKTYQAWNYVPEDSLKAGNRTFNSCGLYYDANGNLKYYNNETDNYKQDNYQLHLIHTVNRRLSLNLTGHYTAGKGYYEQYKPGESLAKYNMPDVFTLHDTITKSDIIRRRWLDNDFVGVLGNINYSPLNTLSFVLGGGYNSYIGRHNGEVIWAQFADPNNFKPRYYDDKATKTDGNVYLKTTFKPIERFTVFVDLQYRTINYRFTGFDTSLVNTAVQDAAYGFFNPKLGLNYLLTPNTNVYASYGIANKEPNRNDFTQSTALSRPKPERLNDLELGVTHRFRHVSLGLNFYDMEYKNQLVLNGQINDVGAYNRVNVDYSYRRGIEAELTADITRFFTFNGNLTLSQNKVRNFTEFIDSSDVNYTVFTQYQKNYSLTDISFSPNVIAAANFIVKPFRNLEVALLNKYVGRQYLDNTSDAERSIHDYLVSDLRVNYTIRTRAIKEINLIAVVYNIFNTVYETNGYNYSYYSGSQLYKQNYLAPAAPTNVMLGLNLRF